MYIVLAIQSEHPTKTLRELGTLGLILREVVQSSAIIKPQYFLYSTCKLINNNIHVGADLLAITVVNHLQKLF